MGDGFNFKTLKREILDMSDANDWEVAKKEWSLVSVADADEPETCLCGHHPIREICTIRNRITGSITDVGNVCLKRFLGLRSDQIFQSLKRIRKDPTKSLGVDAIAHFYERRIINTWEYEFLQDTHRKRILSLKQMAKREQINEKVLAASRRQALVTL